MPASLAPTSAAAAANEFLRLGWEEKGFPPIDQMKLQKLIFYAHAWWLALNDGPLFDEDIEAWPWGPVVRDIYYQTKDAGRAPIVKNMTRLAPSSSGDLFDARFAIPEVKDPKIKDYLRNVWDVHKRFTGIQLSNSTHAHGEPWTIIRDMYGGDLESKPTIPNDFIAAVFKKKLANAASNTAA